MKHNAPHHAVLAKNAAPAPGDESRAETNYSFSKQIGHLLRRAYQRHTAIFQQTIPDSQLTAAQFVAMCAIREFRSCSLTDIVKATAIDQATIRGIIERLRSRQLIEISHDANDGRKVVVSLSPAGEVLVDQTVPFAQRISEDTFGNLNPAERVAILYLLRKMSDFDPNDV
jgi:DNA-binding MarR family transcriptional regulator